MAQLNSVSSILEINKYEKEYQDKRNKYKDECDRKCKKEKQKTICKIIDVWFKLLCEDIVNCPDKWKETYDKIYKAAAMSHTIDIDILTYHRDDGKIDYLYPPPSSISKNLTIGDAADALTDTMHAPSYHVKNKNHPLDNLTFELATKYRKGWYFKVNIVSSSNDGMCVIS